MVRFISDSHSEYSILHSRTYGNLADHVHSYLVVRMVSTCVPTLAVCPSLHSQAKLSKYRSRAAVKGHIRLDLGRPNPHSHSL